MELPSWADNGTLFDMPSIALRLQWIRGANFRLAQGVKFALPNLQSASRRLRFAWLLWRTHAPATHNDSVWDWRPVVILEFVMATSSNEHNCKSAPYQTRPTSFKLLDTLKTPYPCPVASGLAMA